MLFPSLRFETDENLTSMTRITISLGKYVECDFDPLFVLRISTKKKILLI